MVEDKKARVNRDNSFPKALSINILQLPMQGVPKIAQLNDGPLFSLNEIGGMVLAADDRIASAPVAGVGPEMKKVGVIGAFRETSAGAGKLAASPVMQAVPHA